ncbi:MAG: AI-2E family transporter [Halobacteria archaeon]
MNTESQFDRGRLALWLIGFLTFIIIADVLLKFLPALVFSIFFYYSVRPIQKKVKLLPGHSRSIEAALTIYIFIVPFMILILLAFSVAFAELTNFLSSQDITLTGTLTNFLGSSSSTIPTGKELEGAIKNGNMGVIIRPAITHGTMVLGLLSEIFIQGIITITLTYYFLADGHKFRKWIVETLDERGVLTEYIDTLDRELSSILFGNILNAVITSIIAIIVYMFYNLLAPQSVEVPYPALTGAVTGVGSFVPVIGMKIVFIPIAGIMAINAYLTGQLSVLIYVAVFLILALVVVDFIPDIVLRPYISGDQTHMGLLMLAYIMGPVVFGVVGLFLGPIVLVLGYSFVKVILPYLLGNRDEGDYGEPG